MSLGNSHKYRDDSHPRVSKVAIHNQGEGVAVNRKFGFMMKYRRFNRKNTTDEVGFVEYGKDN